MKNRPGRGDEIAIVPRMISKSRPLSRGRIFLYLKITKVSGLSKSGVGPTLKTAPLPEHLVITASAKMSWQIGTAGNVVITAELIQ